MAIMFSGCKPVRINFGRIAAAVPMPNLIEVQKRSYDGFLQREVPEEQRLDVGIQEVFKSVFPIKDFSGRGTLEYVRFEFEDPKYDVEECQQRGMTYAAPLKVILRLVVWDIEEETGARSIRDIKEQDVYMGDMPLMTDNGTFVVNGTERVIVSQMHRSPGVFFDHDKGKTHSSGKYLFAARVIPYRGSWLDFEFDAKDLVFVRIDRRRKLPVTTLLMALDGNDTERLRAERAVEGRSLDADEVTGLSPEEILDYFYEKVTFTSVGEGWKTEFRPERMRGLKLTRDLIDANTGEHLADAGAKLTPRLLRDLDERGLKDQLVPDEDLVGRYVAEDVINEETGEIYVEAGGEITEESLAALKDIGVQEIRTLAIDHINVGPYMRNTLAVDKNSAREEALFDIYRVMRPGEPPTIETAEALFNGLFFDSERYDLSAVGRVKMNARLGFETDDSDPGVAQAGHPRGRQGAGGSQGWPRRNRRHRPSRQPPRAIGRRAAGEPVPHRPVAHGAGHPRAHELGRHRYGHAAGTDQRQAGRGGRSGVFRIVPAQSVHGSDQSAVRDHPQAAAVGSRAGRPDPRAGRVRGPRRPPHALRAHLPHRNAGRAEHRSDQLVGHVRPGQQVRLHRNALPAGGGRPGQRRGRLHVGDGRGPLHHRAGQRRAG